MVRMTVSAVEQWRPVNVLRREVRAAYVRDGIGDGSIIPYPDERPIAIRLDPISRPSENERYDGRRVYYHRSGDWAVNVSGGAWFREPESWYRPSIAVLEFEDGGFSIVRQTAALGEDVTELVVPGTPGDGGGVEFKVSAPVHLKGLSVECRVRLPQWEPDEEFYYVRDVPLVPGESSKVRIPFGAEVWITDFDLPEDANLDVVAPRQEDTMRLGASSRWGPPFRAGDTVDIKLVSRDG